jgi:glucoamylase
MGPDVACLVVVLTTVVAPIPGVAGGTASGGPGGAASWTTGNKLAVGTSADTASKVWFTVARGITSEVFYPRLDVPNMQDMQYVVTDGATFMDVERDATVARRSGWFGRQSGWTTRGLAEGWA